MDRHHPQVIRTWTAARIKVPFHPAPAKLQREPRQGFFRGPAKTPRPQGSNVRSSHYLSREAEMVLASQLHVGAVVRFKDQDYRVIGTEYRPWPGQNERRHARPAA
jgi:hypothetical protein